jgi:hypothetical protein
MRLLTLFFGLGVAREEAVKKFASSLEPFKPLEKKMAIFTNLELKQAHDFGSGEPHFKVGDVVFVGDPQKREYEASGPSLEQIVKKALHPNGVPTRLGSKSIGMWFRTGSVSQYTRHWNQDGSPGERPERRPTRIFEQMFGGATPSGTPMDPAAITARHMKRSVLDAVIGEYKHFMGDASTSATSSSGSLPPTPRSAPPSRKSARTPRPSPTRGRTCPTISPRAAPAAARRSLPTRTSRRRSRFRAG